MNVAIDLGNSCAKAVAFNGLKPIKSVKAPYGSLSDITLFCQQLDIEKGIWASVAGSSPEILSMLSSLHFPLIHFEPGITKTPIHTYYADPTSLGADRWAASVEASLRHPDSFSLVIDAGSCITYDFIYPDYRHLGGLISPGADMRLKALNAFTASLPLVECQDPNPNIPQSTDDAIRNGVIYGLLHEVHGFISSFIANHSDYNNYFIYITGGSASLLSPLFSGKLPMEDNIILDPLLVAEGLNRILLLSQNTHDYD